MDKVSPGSPLSDSPLTSASFVNNVADSVADYKRRAQGGGGDGKFTPASLSIVGISNETGEDLRRGDCVQLGEPLLDELDPLHLWFEGNTVAEPVDLRFVILREPVPDGKIGTAQAAGVCIAWVNVTDADHTHATPVDGEVALDSAADGPFELLQAPDGTGEQELCVRFAGGSEIPCPEAADEFVDLTIEGEGSTSANTTTWAACNEDDKGCKIKEETRTVYSHSGDKKLYGFQREWVISADGRIVSIGEEVRYEIDAAEPCS